MKIGAIGFAAEINRYVEEHGEIVIGLAGTGQMGTDIVVQCSMMPGVRIGAISEIRTDNALAAVEMAGHSRDSVTAAATSDQVDAAIEKGRIALTEDFDVLCGAGRIDVVIDATGNPEIGTRIALAAMKNGKHVVMLNVEADITIGRFLKQEARRAGVVYTGAAGDEPAATLELISFAQSLGLDIVCAGKGKNNPLNFSAVPADYEEEARRRNMNARMLVEFVDGSKTMIEMTAIAQATGLVPDVAGMHGPAATRDELAGVLCEKADGGILSKAGCVDYSIGKGIAPGVFCVVKPKHPRVLERFVDLKVGPGPCFALFRPYHLTSLEVPLSAIRAVVRKEPDMQPLDRPVAECVTIAKRDLAPGDRLGKIGETDYRAFAVTAEQATSGRGLPLGLAEGATVTRPVKSGEAITYDNARADETMLVARIRRDLEAADARLVA